VSDDRAKYLIIGGHNVLIERVADGQYLRLSGSSIVGGDPSAGSAAWEDIVGKPVFGTAAAANEGDFDAAGSASAAMATHVGLADPHAQYALEASLAAVAISGAYADLSGKPSLFDGAYASLTGKPTLGTLASQSGTFSGTSSGTNTGDQDLSALAPKNAPTFTGNITYNAGVIVTDTATGLQIASGATQKLGFWGATPVARPSAYTQTYATASKTHAAVTQLAAPAGGTGAAAGAWSTAANRDLAIASINAARTDIANLKNLVNAVIDDLQAMGILA
jgi:hypothetical protein